jgi:hypothetical protein
MALVPRRTASPGHWPLYTAYQQAVRHPKMYFDDPNLKGGQAEIGMYGLPQTYSGNFGCVFKYKLQNNETRGLKCFSSFLRDREQRYAAIRDFHARMPSSFLMDFEYKANQIFVQGQRYPLLMMEWIQGRSLDAFIEDLLESGRDPGPDINDVASEFVAVMRALGDANAAHGDLQHGNIMITPGGLRMVDLDGMFVPSIASLGSVEMGLRDYQHPKRDVNVFGPELDRFSALVIYLSLQALREDPGLWERFHIDLNMIFSADDFKNPHDSEVFRILLGMKGEVSRLTDVLIRSCGLPPMETPALETLTAASSRPGRGVAGTRIMITDAAGREVESLTCGLGRIGSGRNGGGLTFTIRNLASAPTWIALSSNLPGLDFAGPRAFLLEGDGHRLVSCRLTLAQPLGNDFSPGIRISSGRWHAPDAMLYSDIPLRLLAVSLTDDYGNEILEFQRRRDDLTPGAKAGPARAVTRNPALGAVAENLGNVAVRLAPFVKQDWLRILDTAAFSLQPGERRSIALNAELTGAPQPGAAATIALKVTPIDGEPVELEEVIRLRIIERPANVVDRFRRHFRTLRRLGDGIVGQRETLP